jgi:hypothetical protein
MGQATPQQSNTFTERVLTQGLSGELLGARQTCAGRPPASARSGFVQPRGHHDFVERLPIFVRLRKTFLEVCLFVRRTVEDPRIRRVYPFGMRSAHMIHIDQTATSRIGFH